MSAHVRILDFKITPRGKGEAVLRLYVPGDIYADFILPDEVQQRLAAHFISSACPLCAGTANLPIGSSVTAGGGTNSNANREIGGPRGN